LMLLITQIAQPQRALHWRSPPDTTAAHQLELRAFCRAIFLIRILPRLKSRS
jgi:hypothetical protein